MVVTTSRSHYQFIQSQHTIHTQSPHTAYSHHKKITLKLLLERDLCVQPERFARPCSPGSPCSLLRTCFGDGGDQQRLHPNAGVVHLYFLFFIFGSCEFKEGGEGRIL